LISKLLRLDVKILNFPGIFLLHFINWGLGGVGLLLAIKFVPQLSAIPILLLGLLYGFLLWILTLAPIHKPITGLHPWNHPLGKGPALASLSGHALYGLVLGSIFLITGVKMWTRLENDKSWKGLSSVFFIFTRDTARRQ
jgi:hypothetical protein